MRDANHYPLIIITVGVPEHWGDKKKFPITSTGFSSTSPRKEGRHLGGFNVVTTSPKKVYEVARRTLAEQMATFQSKKGRVVDAATGQIVTEAGPKRLANPVDHPPHSIVVYTTVYQPWEEGDDQPDSETDDGEVFSAEPDEYDIEVAEEMRHGDNPLSSISLAAAIKAALIILEHGFVEPSSYPGFHPHMWYTTSDPDENYRTGERTERSFHLHGWTEAEERAVYDDVMFAMRPRR